ncbi:MAG: NAD(P)-dependent oxidoreductase [Pirellulaceae bacterium]|nr:NAD(P)-dependent oxidoreductase [Pirellulaceae bacterium]
MPQPAFQNEVDLEEALSRPTVEVIKTLQNIDGDMVFLGVAGKMGPTLARMARRASDMGGIKRRIIGVSRFTSGGQQELEAHGIETIQCDLLDEDQVARLPDAPAVVMMTGMKFGSTGNSSLTWAMNDYAPMLMARRYRNSKIVAFSTGNVYGLTEPASGGSVENDATGPIGEYAMSVLGRERLLEHFSRTWSIPMAILRLNYACDLRYGVLVDIATRILNDEPVNVAMGYFNTIWQGDANAMTLRAFGLLKTPPHVINMTGPEVLSIREVASRMAERMGREVVFTGTEGSTALLNNAHYGYTQWGQPHMRTNELIEAVADWTSQGGRLLGKPTHFEARDGKF